MAAPRKPAGLGPGGSALWRGVVADHELDPMQIVQLTEACRAKDRLDKLDEILRGDTDTWVELIRPVGVSADEPVYEVRVTGPLMKANETANSMKMLLAALRLPDEASGKRPQRRGPRGAQKPSVPGGKTAKVSSLERARAAKSS